MADELDQPPIHDKEAERAVLGAVLMDTDAIPRVMSILGESSDAFFTTNHKLTYSAVVTVYNQNRKADIISVAQLLKNTNQLKRVGGSDYLYDLQARIVETENTAFHAQIVYEKWMRRKLIKASETIRSSASDTGKELNAVIADAQQAVYDFTTEHLHTDSQLASDFIVDFLPTLQDPSTNAAIPTGFTDLDIHIQGLQPSNLIVIGARPSMGKSALAFNIAQNVTFDHNKSVAFFSVEMPRKELMMRLLSSESGVPFTKILHRKFSDEDWQTLCNAGNQIHERGKIIINDNRGITVEGIKVEARHLKAKHDDLALIIVDYIQLLRTDHDTQNREREVAHISRELQTLAGELEIPLIACSQLNRESAQARDRRPNLAQLRDSGAIEQDADVVLFLHNNSDQIDLRQLIIAKNRNGAAYPNSPDNDINLRFYPETMTFSDYSI